MPANIQKSASGSWVRSNVKLTGKTVVVTGGNTGIGLETAKDLARRSAKVIIACRSLERAQQAKVEIVEETGCEGETIVVKHLDLASFDSIKKFAADINSNEPRLDILINNAGVMMCPEGKTKDGFETQFGVNHLGHFLLTNLLLDIIKRSAPSRIVVLSSTAHKHGRINWDDLNMRNGYSSNKAYSQSKLMNVLFVKELADRLKDTKVTTYAVHPGVVKTDLWRHVFDGEVSCWRSCLSCCTSPLRKCFLKTSVHGAQTSIYCAIAPELENVTGKYFSDCEISRESSRAKKLDDAKRLWEVSEEFVGRYT